MPVARSWIRFSGLLWEDLTFEPDVGWETDTIAARPDEGEGPWRASLHDEAGELLAMVRPNLLFVDPGGTRAMRRARVVAYLPLRPGSAELRLARNERVVHTARVSPFAPKVRLTSLEVKDGNVHAAWDALHPDPAAPSLTYRVVYAAPGRGVFPVAEDLAAPWFTIALDQLPGSRGGRLAVLATDGIRSATDVSEAFAVPLRPARVAILQPKHEVQLPADQPLSLRAVAHDDAGRQLPANGAEWSVNGELQESGRYLVCLAPLPPGRHEITFAWDGADAPRSETTIVVRVRGRAQAPDSHNEAPRTPPKGVPLRIKL